MVYNSRTSNLRDIKAIELIKSDSLTVSLSYGKLLNKLEIFEYAAEKTKLYTRNTRKVLNDTTEIEVLGHFCLDRHKFISDKS